MQQKEEVPSTEAGLSSDVAIDIRAEVRPPVLRIDTIGLQARTPGADVAPQGSPTGRRLRSVQELRTQGINMLMSSPQARLAPEYFVRPQAPSPPRLPPPGGAGAITSMTDNLLERTALPMRILPPSSPSKAEVLQETTALPSAHVVNIITKSNASVQLGLLFTGKGASGSVRIHGVVPNSLGAAADFRVGQRIWEINGVRILSASQAASIVASATGALSIISVPPRPPGKLRALVKKVLVASRARKTAARRTDAAASELGIGDGCGESSIAHAASPPRTPIPRTPISTHRELNDTVEVFDVVLERMSTTQQFGLGIRWNNGRAIVCRLDSIGKMYGGLMLDDQVLAINEAKMGGGTDLIKEGHLDSLIL